jgi:hypothetical protein
LDLAAHRAITDRSGPVPSGRSARLGKREDRERTEKALKDQGTRAQTNPVNPPGDPSCSAANPSLCPSKPTRPADQNGGYVDRTTQTGDSADRTYQNAVTTLGSTIGHRRVSNS